MMSGEKITETTKDRLEGANAMRADFEKDLREAFADLGAAAYYKNEEDAVDAVFSVNLILENLERVKKEIAEMEAQS